MSRRQLALAAIAGVLVSSAANADSLTSSCARTGKISSLFQTSSTRGGWSEIEEATEKPFQEVIGAGLASKDALANFNDKLDRYGWTLTRYTVQLLHELDAESLPEASERLSDDAYASDALSDAMWDGFNGWSIVSSLRPQTLEILKGLEDVRTGAAEFAGAAQKKSLVGKAQKVTERLLKEAESEQPAELSASCERRPQVMKLGA